MTVFNIHCQDPWFSYIRQGLKKVEGRTATHSYKKIKVGDQINFTNGIDSFMVKVTKIQQFPSLEEYFESVTVESALPGVKSIEEGLETYYQWTSEEKIRHYGFLALFVELV